MQATRRVLFVVLEGADFDYIESDWKQGELPALAALSRQGVCAPLSTVLPINPVVQMFSMLTGHDPVAHGVFGGLVERDQALLPAIAVPCDRPLIWAMLAQRGVTQLLLNWPASWCGQDSRVHWIQESAIHAAIAAQGAGGLAPESVHGPGLASTLESLVHRVDEIGLAEIHPFLVGAATLGRQDKPAIAAVGRALGETLTTHNLATSALETGDHDLVAVRYPALHPLGRLFAGQVPLDDRDQGIFGDAAYPHLWGGLHRFHDLLLARLIELAGGDTDIIVVSPFGMRRGRARNPRADNDYEIYRQQGFLLAAGPHVRSRGKTLGASILDLTPTLLRLFETSEGQDMPGRALAEVFDVKLQPSTIASWGGTTAHATSSAAIWPAAMPVQNPDPGVTARLRVGKAQALAVAGQLEAAIVLLREVLTLDPNAVEAARVLGHLLLDRGELDGAEQVLGELQRRGGSDFDYNLGLARLASQSGDHDGCLAHLFAILAKRPDHGVVHYYIAAEYEQIGRGDDAIAAYRQAVALDRHHFPSWLGLARVLFAAGSFDDAVEAALDALERSFSDPRAHWALARPLAELGRDSEAAAACEAALRFGPANIEIHEALVVLYRRPTLADEANARRHLIAVARLRAQAASRER